MQVAPAKQAVSAAQTATAVQAATDTQAAAAAQGANAAQASSGFGSLQASAAFEPVPDPSFIKDLASAQLADNQQGKQVKPQESARQDTGELPRGLAGKESGEAVSGQGPERFPNGWYMPSIRKGDSKK